MSPTVQIGELRGPVRDNRYDSPPVPCAPFALQALHLAKRRGGVIALAAVRAKDVRDVFDDKQPLSVPEASGPTADLDADTTTDTTASWRSTRPRP